MSDMEETLEGMAGLIAELLNGLMEVQRLAIKLVDVLAHVAGESDRDAKIIQLAVARRLEEFKKLIEEAQNVKSG